MRGSRIHPGKAAFVSALLCAAFFLTYGGTNALSAARGVTRAMYFEWERIIPFVPLMIVPYMSIDAFFVVAPFLCRDEGELKRLSKRILLGLVVTAVCFLVFPLKFSFPRPTTTGPLGAFFDWFRTMDQPFNQLPSLHMTLRTILSAHYARHLSRGWRRASNVWFSLIGFSTVLTYQHHVVDVVGGTLLGITCLYLVPEKPRGRQPVGNARVGRMYAAAAACFFIAALAVFGFAAMPWRAAGIPLTYLAIAFAAVAMGYFRWGAGAYLKEDGRLHWSSKVLLAPVLLGQWLSLKHYARRSDRWNEITDQILLGRWLSPTDAKDLGVTAILDVTCEFDAISRPPGVAYLNIPVLDLTAPSDADLERAFAFLDEQLARENGQGRIYVHCKAGFSRSAAVVGAYLISRGHVQSAAEAAELLRAKRPGIVLRPEVMALLQRVKTSRTPERLEPSERGP